VITNRTEPDRNSQEALTQLLLNLTAGEGAALDRLIPLVYDEMRLLAHAKLQFERDSHTLNTTALVHEAYLRLIDQQQVEWRNRAHFFAIVAMAMRRILVNYALERKAAKRGGGSAKISLDEALNTGLGVFSDERIDDVLAIHHALERLETFNERGCRVVEYRFFGGLNYEEIAEVMGVSQPTVRRAWSAAKAWLRREMKEL
jgi:RNA polymerase sigma factor (TIGR02999 family)